MTPRTRRWGRRATAATSSRSPSEVVPHLLASQAIFTWTRTSQTFPSRPHWRSISSARVFVLSHYTARALQEVTGLPPSFFEVLRTPIDSAAFTPDGRRWERAPGRYVVSMGRVGDGRKHYTSLVRCFARIAS